MASERLYPKPGVQIIVIIDFHSATNIIFPQFDDSSTCLQYLGDNKTGNQIYSYPLDF